jgi:TRAP-type C4-dicarboxylate transport system permease small subunit
VRPRSDDLVTDAGADARPAGRGGWPAGLAGILGLLAAVALFGMMTLTFADVVGRKFLGNSIIGSVELTELMMLALIYTALPLASFAGEHVVFDLLDSFLPEPVKRWQAVISNLICTVLLGFAAWFVLERAIRTQAMGDTTAQLQIPVSPFQFAAAGLIALSALMHLYLATSRKDRT